MKTLSAIIAATVITASSAPAVIINFIGTEIDGSNTLYGYTIDWGTENRSTQGDGTEIIFESLFGVVGAGGTNNETPVSGTTVPSIEDFASDWSQSTTSTSATFSYNGTNTNATETEGLFVIAVNTATTTLGIINWSYDGPGAGTDSGTVVGAVELIVPEPTTTALLIGAAALSLSVTRRRKLA